MADESDGDRTLFSYLTVPLGNWVLRRFGPPELELAYQLARSTNANPNTLEQLEEQNIGNQKLVKQLREVVGGDELVNQGSRNIPVGMPVKMPETIVTFHSAFENRCKVYGTLFLLMVVVIPGTDYLVQGSIPDQFLGLTIEVLGAAALGRGLVKSIYDITGEVLRYNTTEVLTSDMVDGIFGLSFLGLGILTQYVALLGFGVPYSFFP